MSINVKWDITYKCNLNCKHCINGDLLGKIDNEATTEEVKSIIGKLAEGGVDRVHLLGGEPTARVDFLEIIKCFEDNSLEFGFNTNGVKLFDESVRSEIMSNKMLRNIVFSLEGPSKEVNDAIRGKKVFELTKNNLAEVINLKKIFGRTDIIITVNTVVSKVNLAHISEMIDFCVEMGVDQLVLLQLIDDGNAKDINQGISIDDTINLINIISKRYSEVKDRLTITPRFATPLAKRYCSVVLGREYPDSNQMCGAGTDFYYLNNKGEVYPCDRYKNQILEKNNEKDIKLQNGDLWSIADTPGFGDLFEMSEGNEAYQKKKVCQKCEYFKTSCYPCVLSSDKDDELCKRMMEEIEECIK